MHPRLCLAVVFLSAAIAPTAEPLDPRGLPGPLVIAGGAKTLSTDARDAFFDLAKKEKAKIVVVTSDEKKGLATLANWEDRKSSSLALLTAKDRKQADDVKNAEFLTEATAVWIEATDAEQFTKLYGGTLIEMEIKKLHARGGVIGTSHPRTLSSMLPGFAFGSSSDLKKEIAARPDTVGLTIADDAALVIRGRVARVIGDGTVTVHVTAGAGKRAAADEYKAGSLLDLPQMRRAAANRAAKEPFPPAKPLAPFVAKGTLIIVGGGGTTKEIMETFFDRAGGKDALIVAVPTTPEFGPSEVKYIQSFGAKNVKLLYTRDRKEADDPKFSEMLTKAGGVWFGGGRQWNFVDCFEGTLTEKRFHEVLARGGVIGGSSAGASIQSEYMPRGHPLGNTVMAAEGYERGFGFLPGCAVDQHFFARKRTEDMTGLMKKYPQYLGIGIDESTAIVVTGGVAQVMGKSKVAFYDTKKKPDGEMDYEEVYPNNKYDLVKRAKVKE